MDIGNFLTWFIFIAVVMGVALGIMIQAYIGSGSISVLFKEPVALPPSLAGAEAAVYFQEGYDAYKNGKYRQAIDRFSKAIQQVPTCAEAYHNRGQCSANLGQDDDATRNLVSASELYVQQENHEAIALIKQNLQALKARKLTRENRHNTARG